MPLAAVDFWGGCFVSREELPDVSLGKLQSLTGARQHVEGEVAELIVPEWN